MRVPELVPTRVVNMVLQPNPTSETLRWEWAHVSNPERPEVEVFDRSGRLVLHGSNAERQLNVSSLPEGSYTLRIVSEWGTPLAQGSFVVMR